MPTRLQNVDLSLIDSLTIPASLHETSGRFVHVNEAALRASGTTKEYWLGRSFTDPLPPGAREQVEAQFRRAVETGEPAEFETVFIDGHGTRRGVRAQHLPLRADGEVLGVLILAFDVRLARDLDGLPREPRLTPRQREILDFMDAGLSTTEIAARLTLSTETVRNYVRSVLREFNAHTRVEAIATARRLGLLAPPALQPPDNG